MDIISLRDAPQHLPTLARWHHEQWTYLNPGRTLKQRIDDMREQLQDQLVRRVMDAARQGGIETLYLFTPDQARLYASLGWRLIAEENYFDERVSLMRVALH